MLCVTRVIKLLTYLLCLAFYVGHSWFSLLSLMPVVSMASHHVLGLARNSVVCATKVVAEWFYLFILIINQSCSHPQLLSTVISI